MDIHTSHTEGNTFAFSYLKHKVLFYEVLMSFYPADGSSTLSEWQSEATAADIKKREKNKKNLVTPRKRQQKFFTHECRIIPPTTEEETHSFMLFFSRYLQVFN